MYQLSESEERDPHLDNVPKPVQKQKRIFEASVKSWFVSRDQPFARIGRTGAQDFHGLCSSSSPCSTCCLGESVIYIVCLPQSSMPTGTPYNSFVLPYKIRVDDFATPTSNIINPALHLLTHTHADHINGLSAKSFGYQVICSHDAKEMLLRHEVYAERALHEQELRAEKTRTFSHLKVDPRVENDGRMYYSGSRDLLVCLLL